MQIEKNQICTTSDRIVRAKKVVDYSETFSVNLLKNPSRAIRIASTLGVVAAIKY